MAIQSYKHYTPMEDVHARTTGGMWTVWAFSTPGTFDDREPVQKFPGPDGKDLAKQLADQLNAQERERIVAEPLTRYETSWYVSILPAEAQQDAEIDHTPPEKIRVTEGIRLIHNTGSWALWSDHRITTAIGLKIPSGGPLTKDAESLISTVRGADGGSVHLPGGIWALTQIQQTRHLRDFAVGPNRGLYARERIEELAVEWLNGTTSRLYVTTAGYFEGYAYDIYGSLEEVRAALGSAPGPEGMVAFPAGPFDHNSEPGTIQREEKHGH